MPTAKRKAAPKPSKKSIKAAADRAEKRAKGEEIETPKVAIDPEITPAASKAEELKEERRGRPTAYDPSFDARAAELCEAGARDDELAEEFGVSVRTINRWKVAQPSFRQAIKDSKDVADERVQRSLYHRAMGGEVEELQAIKLKRVVYEDGKRAREEEYIELVPVRKHIPADTTAAIFWLKNRRAQAWRDVQRHEHGRPGDFSDLDDDALEDYIRTESSRLLAEESPSRRRH